jgi:hypothetical protein
MQELVFVRHLAIWIFLLMLSVSCNISKRNAVPIIDEPTTAVQGVLATIEQGSATRIPAVIMVTQKFLDPPPAPMAAPTTTVIIPVTTQVEVATGFPSLGFKGLRFALTAEGAAQSEFLAGTDEVYAVWEYAGMSATDNIRRIWFRDDQIWLTREEGWNWGEYGSDGTIRDISVYDDEGSGLASATYRLQLYVNDELQGDATFVVLAP